VSSPFDPFSWFYDRYWAAPFEAWQRPALERVLLPYVKPGGRILDLCCGTGTLARQLVARGYKMTGVDSSEGMLRIARENVPAGIFLQADATDFFLNKSVDAAVCVFDSLNHLLEAGQLQSAFQSVSAALNSGGCFVFDINTEAAYGERWDHTFCEVQPDHAFFLRGGFDPKARIGHTRVTMFRLAGSWERSDVEIRQRPWEVGEIEIMLHSAGFSDVRPYRAFEDLEMTGHYGIGRVFFRACKNPT
jgi:SAM-dependent methyltransferase